MPTPIDLRKLRPNAGDGLTPERELPPPAEEPLLSGGTAGRPAQSSLLEWEALEFEPEPERAQLLLILGLFLGAGGIAAFFFANALFALFLLISGGLIASYAFRQPRSLRLAVTPAGVKIENRLYEFADLKSFWISYDPPLFKDLILESKKAVMPVIRAPLGGTDPLRLREILLRFLREERREETLMDIIIKRLGF